MVSRLAAPDCRRTSERSSPIPSRPGPDLVALARGAKVSDAEDKEFPSMLARSPLAADRAARAERRGARGLLSRMLGDVTEPTRPFDVPPTSATRGHRRGRADDRPGPGPIIRDTASRYQVAWPARSTSPRRWRRACRVRTMSCSERALSGAALPMRLPLAGASAAESSGRRTGTWTTCLAPDRACSARAGLQRSRATGVAVHGGPGLSQRTRFARHDAAAGRGRRLSSPSSSQMMTGMGFA